jgi:hypothetical protein
VLQGAPKGITVGNPPLGGNPLKKYPGN